jgi:membrane protein
MRRLDKGVAEQNTKQEMRADAPSPDADEKPGSPTQLDKRSWKYVLSRTYHEFTADQCMDAAAGLTYYGVLSIFPGILAVFSLLGVFGQGRAASKAVIGIIDQVAPGDTAHALQGPIEQFSKAPGAGFALVFGIVLAVWSASGYVGAFGRAMNRIYEIEEGRPFWKLRPVQLGVTLVTIVAVVVIALVLVLSGKVVDAVGNAIGASSVITLLWNVVKWPLLLFVVVVLIATLYYATPNAKQPKFRWLSLGAIVAIVVLAVASALFILYVANFSNYDRTYGSLAGVIVFLLWLWIANLALLFGAEFDSELERARELQGGIQAEEDLQLPARDTRNIDKEAKRDEKDIAAGRSIREDHDGSQQGERVTGQSERR